MKQRIMANPCHPHSDGNAGITCRRTAIYTPTIAEDCLNQYLLYPRGITLDEQTNSALNHQVLESCQRLKISVPALCELRLGGRRSDMRHWRQTLRISFLAEVVVAMNDQTGCMCQFGKATLLMHGFLVSPIWWRRLLWLSTNRQIEPQGGNLSIFRARL